MLPTLPMGPGQLVPNWNDITMPGTTPIAKVGAKILTHWR